ncbi:MAG: hypothetical protein ABIA04_15675 [Pseudomonadota bacterium]
MKRTVQILSLIVLFTIISTTLIFAQRPVDVRKSMTKREALREFKKLKSGDQAMMSEADWAKSNRDMLLGLTSVRSFDKGTRPSETASEAGEIKFARQYLIDNVAKLMENINKAEIRLSELDEIELEEKDKIEVTEKSIYIRAKRFFENCSDDNVLKFISVLSAVEDFPREVRNSALKTLAMYAEYAEKTDDTGIPVEKLIFDLNDMLKTEEGRDPVEIVEVERHLRELRKVFAIAVAEFAKSTSTNVEAMKTFQFAFGKYHVLKEAKKLGLTYQAATLAEKVKEIVREKLERLERCLLI